MSNPENQFGAIAKGLLPDANRFIELEYENVNRIISELNTRKMAYQQLFVTMVSVIGAVAVALIRFAPGPVVGDLSLIQFVGILLLVCASLGFAITRNLASIRHACVLHATLFFQARNSIIKILGLSFWPTIESPKLSDKDSSDNVTILVCSAITCSMVVFGVICLFFGAASQANPIALAATVLIVVAVYISLHFWQIKSLLREERLTGAAKNTQEIA